MQCPSCINQVSFAAYAHFLPKERHQIKEAVTAELLTAHLPLPLHYRPTTLLAFRYVIRIAYMYDQEHQCLVVISLTYP